MTILFTNDWEKPENRGVIVDYETKNQSFVRYSALLREMGVKNHLWPLQLHDAGLQGVDPFDPNITPEMAVRVALESKRNFFYHIRELARDPSGSNEFPILFQANRGVMATYWLFFNHVLVLLIMIRQTGKTFGVDHLLTYLINIRLTKTEISYLTKDEKLRGREVDRLKAIELSLPEYLKQRTFRDPGNTEVFKIGSLDNSIKLYVPNRSPKLADLVGRGMTSPITVADEFAYLANSSITIPVMLAATLAAREVAQMKNDPYGNIFMTTSGKRDTPEGRYAYNFMQSCAEWNERLLDAADEQSLHDLVRKAGNGRDLRVNCTLNHRQLGKSDAWLRDRLRESAQEDQVQIEADFLNRWPSGTTFSPFSQETAEGIRNSEVLDPYINIDSDDAYAFRWYYKELEIAGKLFQAPHILSIDPSEQVGQDSIGVVLRNVFTGEVSMAADISEGNLIVFSKWIANFLVKNLNVLLIVERRSMGTAILDYVILFLTNEGIDPFRRIFNQVVQLAEEYPERFKEIQNPFSSRENLFIKYKKQFGWSTSGSGATSRTDLYSRTLSAAARMTGSLTRDRALILQILGLEIRNGRVDHGEGEHDDLVIAWLLSYWILSLGKNLKHYGIEPNRILTDNPTYRQDLKAVSSYDQEVFNKARADVEELSAILKEERDEYVAKRLEFDLERALSRLSETDRKVISADDLIHKLREERNRNTRKNTVQDYYEQEFGTYNQYLY
jgi:hypothetical protein